MAAKRSFWENVAWILIKLLPPSIIKKLNLISKKDESVLHTQQAIVTPDPIPIPQTPPSVDKTPRSPILAGRSPKLYPLSRSLSGLENKERSEPWERYREDLEIHWPLLEKGILAVRTACMNPSKQSPSNDSSFSLSSRTLFFANSNNQDLTHAKKTVTLLNDLNTFCEPKCALNDKHPYTVIHNKERREELFLPLVIKDASGKQIGFYTYPWLSSNAKFEFVGFEEFVVAGCIFGSLLMGQDQNNATFPLMKHGIKFLPTQKIMNIKCNLTTFGSYENMLFLEFEQQVLLMKKCEKKGKKMRLRYHLPYYDYILFGLELFGRGRISLAALNLFFKAIFTRKKQHEQEIYKICQMHDISCMDAPRFARTFHRVGRK